MFTRMILAAIRFYQRGISPFSGSSCRFTPTCSEFAAQAFERHGAMRGGWFARRGGTRLTPVWGLGP